jgi:hypothetical protein
MVIYNIIRDYNVSVEHLRISFFNDLPFFVKAGADVKAFVEEIRATISINNSCEIIERTILFTVFL